jgi:hypothetical protein
MLLINADSGESINFTEALEKILIFLQQDNNEWRDKSIEINDKPQNLCVGVFEKVFLVVLAVHVRLIVLLKSKASHANQQKAEHNQVVAVNFVLEVVIFADQHKKV